MLFRSRSRIWYCPSWWGLSNSGKADNPAHDERPVPALDVNQIIQVVDPVCQIGRVKGPDEGEVVIAGGWGIGLHLFSRWPPARVLVQTGVAVSGSRPLSLTS